MRTTLDIAEDVLLAAKALGKRERKSVGQILSELARKGLGMPKGQTVRSGQDFEMDDARAAYHQCRDLYPIFLTRDLPAAKTWLRDHARGTERFGVVVSSAAERLRPHAINVKAPMVPVHWFLDGKEDVRSSYYLEDVATEFHVQGLELDWTCVTWDADFRYTRDGWKNWNFVGSRWNRVHQPDRQRYQKNAYLSQVGFQVI